MIQTEKRRLEAGVVTTSQDRRYMLTWNPGERRSSLARDTPRGKPEDAESQPRPEKMCSDSLIGLINTKVQSTCASMSSLNNRTSFG